MTPILGIAICAVAILAAVSQPRGVIKHQTRGMHFRLRVRQQVADRLVG